MKLLIVGYGKMGKMVDDMAADHGFEVVGRVDVGRNEWRNLRFLRKRLRG